MKVLGKTAQRDAVGCSVPNSKSCNASTAQVCRQKNVCWKDNKILVHNGSFSCCVVTNPRGKKHTYLWWFYKPPLRAETHVQTRLVSLHQQNTCKQALCSNFTWRWLKRRVDRPIDLSIPSIGLTAIISNKDFR